MTWKPTIGRNAKTRDGQLVTNIRKLELSTLSMFTLIGRAGIGDLTFTEDGSYSLDGPNALDLVADWQDEQPWKPTIGRDARTRGGKRATGIRAREETGLLGRGYTLQAEIDGAWRTFTPEGRYDKSVRSHMHDLVADWQDDLSFDGCEFSTNANGVQLVSPYPLEPAEGRKDDSGKPRYDLLPPELMDSTAQVLTFGAVKYSARNWEKGMAWGRPFAALMRHMWAWWKGEKNDPETGLSHLAHAACCIAFLLAYEARGVGTDNRPEAVSAK